MYKLVKIFYFSASHSLRLNYESACLRKHGHNYKVIVELWATELDSAGMVADFTALKKIVMDKYDHKDLNEVFVASGREGYNTTVEVLARLIAADILGEVGVERIKRISVTVYETDDSYVSYVEEI